MTGRTNNAGTLQISQCDDCSLCASFPSMPCLSHPVRNQEIQRSPNSARFMFSNVFSDEMSSDPRLGV